jgi:hypothetical protein
MKKIIFTGGQSMIGKQIVKETIMALEDMMDYVEVEHRPELQERLGEIQTLLNFWRMYESMMPAEEGRNEC